MDDGSGLTADRSGLPAGTVSVFRHANDGGLLLLVLAVAGAVVGAGTLRAGVLRGGGYFHADGGGDDHHGCLAADLFNSVSQLRSGGAGVCVGHRNWIDPAGTGMAAALPE